jgi:hypothetical protein
MDPDPEVPKPMDSTDMDLDSDPGPQHCLEGFATEGAVELFGGEFVHVSYVPSKCLFIAELYTNCKQHLSQIFWK